MSKGRKDGSRSNIEDTFNLPSPAFNNSELIQRFGRRGFTVQDMVALSGIARCSSFKSRLTGEDQSVDSDFAKTLAKTCTAGDNAEQPLDTTRTAFDNLYFNALTRKNRVLFCDQTLYADNSRTKAIVNAYAMNQAFFFMDFQRAMVKMSLLDVKEGSNEK